MGAPGIDEVKWLKPCGRRQPDGARQRASARALAEQAGPRLRQLLWEVFNDRGEKVMTLVCPQMLRGASGAVRA
jgi:hypothetical protein